MNKKGMSTYLVTVFLILIIVLGVLSVFIYRAQKEAENASKKGLPDYDPIFSEYDEDSTTVSINGNVYTFNVNGISFKQEEQLTEPVVIEVVSFAMFRDGSEEKMVKPPDNTIGTNEKPILFGDEDYARVDLVFNVENVNKQPNYAGVEFLYVTFWVKGDCVTDYTDNLAGKEISDLVTACPKFYLSSMSIDANVV